ncbi:XRE family transcriptional regulator [Streptomyces parvulus]|uniref:XRE family transcriptional regulator n=1 Tax=Streptomyces parvulus TaxID=146923 RepID=UPI003674E320
MILTQAKAWSPVVAREMATYLEEHPDALTAPSSHCPAALPRLLRQLDLHGYGLNVTQLACPRCGRTDKPLVRPTPEGRCCGWCGHRTELRPCARCGKDGNIVTHREEGPICRACYRRDPARKTKCAKCGQLREPARRENGKIVCGPCAPTLEHECSRCGRMAPSAVAGDEPICRSCYTRPPRLCGVCGEVQPMAKRAADGQPDTCMSCYRSPLGECSVCGRQRPVQRRRGPGGALYCDSCRPRSMTTCVDCDRRRPLKATWPVGALCDTCYRRRTRSPAPCTGCGTLRVLVGRSEQGHDLCGPCSGTEIDYACRRCGFPGNIYADGCCGRCINSDRVHDLLSDEDGNLVPHLAPLADKLTAAEPWAVRNWLATSKGVQVLARLASQKAEITHEVLDGLEQDGSTRYLRELLVTTGVLPRRDENFARIQLWLDAALNGLPATQLRVLRPFAEWCILRDARRRSERGRYTSGAASVDRMEIRAAMEFIAWVEMEDFDLGSLTQGDLDLWVTSHRTRRIGAFIRWTVARRLTGKLTAVPQHSGLPTKFLSSEEHHEQLRRCLNDDELPLEVRIAGALTRLYGLPTVRILQLTTDRFHHEEDGAYLTIDQNPVLLPPKLARLIEQQATRPIGHISIVDQPTGDHPKYLLPGRPPSRPRSAAGLHSLMRQHGLPGLSARNTAMIEAVADLPPIVASDLFGIHPQTAHRWARFAQDSWTDYLAARAATEK